MWTSIRPLFFKTFRYSDLPFSIELDTLSNDEDLPVWEMDESEIEKQKKAGEEQKV